MLKIVKKFKDIINENREEIKSILQTFVYQLVAMYAMIGVFTAILYYMSKKKGNKEIYIPWLLKCSIRAIK